VAELAAGPAAAAATGVIAMLATARARAHDPSPLLTDEPTAHLDYIQVDAVLRHPPPARRAQPRRGRGHPRRPPAAAGRPSDPWPGSSTTGPARSVPGPSGSPPPRSTSPPRPRCHERGDQRARAPARQPAPDGAAPGSKPSATPPPSDGSPARGGTPARDTNAPSVPVCRANSAEIRSEHLKVGRQTDRTRRSSPRQHPGTPHRVGVRSHHRSGDLSRQNGDHFRRPVATVATRLGVPVLSGRQPFFASFSWWVSSTSV
jgi:hypothetical protein